MRTFVLTLLLSTAAWGQTDLTLLASASAATPEFSTSRSATVAAMIKPAAAPVEAPQPVGKRDHNVGSFYALSVASHSAAGFDAWTTRRNIRAGAVELNPMLQPFANSNAIYPVMQITPTMMDYLGRKMMRSNKPLYRRLWWVPQAASMAVSLTCGIHNARNF
jgi:hypothetical protein